VLQRMATGEGGQTLNVQGDVGKLGHNAAIIAPARHAGHGKIATGT
jgi:hypothetical protein